MNETLPPRALRTRTALHGALSRLLALKGFEKISVQEITEAAAINRVTFYDHYPDKFALLEGMVAARFDELLCKRGIQFDRGCDNALESMILAVCDYLSSTACESQHQLDLYLQSAVVAVVRRMVLEGLKRHPLTGPVSAEMAATTVSGALCAAAREWVRSSPLGSSEEAVPVIAKLVSPIFANLN
jgi:AcrR family transcriptional regulator